jgi:undecaprenyl-diphosphatase
MDLWQAFILGIVEGITEFLPISSTGHLVLAAHLLGSVHSEFLKTFEVVIQLGAMGAVVALYWKSLLRDIRVWRRVAAAFIPTAIIGLIFYKLIKHYLGNIDIVIWTMFLGGIFLIVFDLVHRESGDSVKEVARISYKTAVLIGLFQSIAMVPGVSRAAATIIGGLILGIQRKAIVEFSFLLAVPTIFAASVLDLVKNPHPFSPDQWLFLAVGFITSFVVAALSIKFLLRFIESHNFIPFGIYRVVAALALWMTLANAR